MVAFTAFEGHLVLPEVAERVVAPPPNGGRGREHAVLDPLSFLHVIPPEENEPPPTGFGRDALTACRVRLERLAARAFAPLPDPAYVIHRIERGGRTHTGVLGEVPVAEYRTGRIRPHEDVRSEKARRFASSIAVIRASSTPVFLLTDDGDGMREALLGEADASPPLLDVTIADGSRHRLWRAREHTSRTIAEHVAGTEALTIADGHHRTDAFARVAEADGSPDDFRFLVELFPADEVTTAGYHRCVTDLGESTPSELLEAIADRFEVTQTLTPGEDLGGDVRDGTSWGPSADGLGTPRTGTITMWLEGSWYRLRLPEPRDVLDVVVLHEELLAPLLGIEDATSDRRLAFVAGTIGPDAVRERCAGGGAAIGFALAPIPVSTVISEATAGRTLPPKSTWFEPKLPAGLAVRWLDGP